MVCKGRTTEEISDHVRWMVEQKVSILTLALTVAKKNMRGLKNWDACCEEAIQEIYMIRL